jgi:DNA-binding NarL/FixJ family response regulator
VTLRVVLAEDNYIVREGVEKLINSEPDLEVVAACADYDSLMAAVAAETPDVVVTDIRMPPTGTDEGIRAANELRAEHPDLGVVVLSQYSEPKYALDFLESGSRGRAYLLKERVSNIGQLAQAIRDVARGGSVIDPEVVDALVAARSRASDSPLRVLTPRETEILGEMAQGKNNAAVAASLVLSERAVEKHINSIFSKLALSQEPDVHRRVKAVLLFLSAQG